VYLIHATKSSKMIAVFKPELCINVPIEKVDAVQPKPNLRIKIPPPLSDEEILKSPIETPVAPYGVRGIINWLRGI